MVFDEPVCIREYVDREPPDRDDPDPDVYIPMDDDPSTTYTSGYSFNRGFTASSPAVQNRSQASQITNGGHEGFHGNYEFDAEEGVRPDEVHQRFYLWFDAGFQSSDNGKLPGFNGDPNGNLHGTTPPDGTNGWSCRGAYRYGIGPSDPITLGYYVYHVDQPSWPGEYEWWDGTLRRENWYQIDQYIKMNTPGSNDGVLKAWVDEDLVHSSNGWRWRDTTDLFVWSFWNHFYHGGGTAAPSQLTIRTDEYEAWLDSGQQL